jgi:cell wall-associated NlpC family hydrolase
MIRFEDSEQHVLICFGSPLPSCENKMGSIGENSYEYSGDTLQAVKDRELILSSAYTYLHSPYLWGGRTPFGIDCSGLTQMAYRFGGIDLPRDAWQQAELGNALSFIDESEPGDLAFFDNKEGKITHVGLLLEDNRIIHASGQVRIDPIDQTGIYNKDLKRHTHKLRVIKRIL